MTEQSTVPTVRESAPSEEHASQSAAHVSRETNDLVSHGAVTSPDQDADADIDVDVSREVHRGDVPRPNTPAPEIESGSLGPLGLAGDASVSRETNRGFGLRRDASLSADSGGLCAPPTWEDVNVSRETPRSWGTASEHTAAVLPTPGAATDINDFMKHDNDSRGSGHSAESHPDPGAVFIGDSRAEGPSVGGVSRETAHVDKGAGVPKSAALRGVADAGSAVSDGGLRGVDGIDGASDLTGSTVVQRASISDGIELASRGDNVSRETVADDYLPIAGEAKRAVAVLNPSGRTFPSPARRRVFGVANQKGGVGKTTTAVNLAVGLALHGLRVLVIDLDPQGNASTGLDVPHQTGTPSSYDVILDEMEIREAMVPVAGVPNLFCVPATIDLAGAEIELVSVDARERRLHKAIEDLKDEFEYIFIDCPPSLGLLTVNAMVAAREVLIPIQCEYYALEGLGQLIHNIDLVRAHLNSDVRISTILLTMYDKRTKLADQVAAEVRGHFGDKVLGAVIPRSVRVSEAPGYGQSVMTYDPGSRGATSYLEAARELAERCARDETVGTWDEE